MSAYDSDRGLSNVVGWTSGRSFLILCVLILVGVALRLLGIDWLIGSGLQPDFSFHPDENRFVEAAKSFRDYPSLGGYVLGMVTQLFAVLSSTKFLGLDINALLALRSITVMHAAITVLLTYVLSMIWSSSRSQALLASLLIALCPLHILNSNFGTADVTAVSLFYLTIFAGAQYLRSASYLWFTIMVGLCGFALAVKFFIPLLAVVALIVVTERADRRWGLVVSAGFVLAGSFSIASFFNYTPWDFKALIHMILYDNVSIVDGKSPLENAYLYLWRLLPALSVPVAGLALLAIGEGIWNSIKTIRSLPSRLSVDGVREAIRSPTGLLVVPLVLHGIMILIAGVSFTRHLLIYTPVLCVLAASACIRLTTRVTVIGRVGQFVAVTSLVAYLAWNAVGLQLLYRNDIRTVMANWTNLRVAEGHRVYAASFYTPVGGTDYDRNRDLASIADGDYLLTCDLEYERYLSRGDAETVFHAKGGQPRMDFYREVFLGSSRFTVVEVFRQELYTLEQRWIARGWLPQLDTFTPGLCMALGTASPLPQASQQAILREARAGSPTI